MRSNNTCIDRPQYKFLTPLALLYLTFVIATICIAYKPVYLWKLTATASSILFAFSFSINSIIAEVYGQKIARKLVNIVLPCSLLFSVIVSLIAQLPSPPSWSHQQDFYYVFSNSFRFSCFAGIAGLIAYKINILLITKWKVKTHGNLFLLRMMAANIISLFILVLIMQLGAFYGMLPVKQIFSVMLFAYLVKVIFTLVLSGPAALFVRLIGRREGRNINL